MSRHAALARLIQFDIAVDPYRGQSATSSPGGPTGRCLNRRRGLRVLAAGSRRRGGICPARPQQVDCVATRPCYGKPAGSAFISRRRQHVSVDGALRTCSRRYIAARRSELELVRVVCGYQIPWAAECVKPRLNGRSCTCQWKLPSMKLFLVARQSVPGRLELVPSRAPALSPLRPL